MVSAFLKPLLLAVGIDLAPNTPHKQYAEEYDNTNEHTYREVIALDPRPHLKHLICSITRIVHNTTTSNNTPIGI